MPNYKVWFEYDTGSGPTSSGPGTTILQAAGGTNVKATGTDYCIFTCSSKSPYASFESAIGRSLSLGKWGPDDEYEFDSFTLDSA